MSPWAVFDRLGSRAAGRLQRAPGRTSAQIADIREEERARLAAERTELLAAPYEPAAEAMRRLVRAEVAMWILLVVADLLVAGVPRSGLLWAAVPATAIVALTTRWGVPSSDTTDVLLSGWTAAHAGVPTPMVLGATAGVPKSAAPTVTALPSEHPITDPGQGAWRGLAPMLSAVPFLAIDPLLQLNSGYPEILHGAIGLFMCVLLIGPVVATWRTLSRIRRWEGRHEKTLFRHPVRPPACVPPPDPGAPPEAPPPLY